jgi:hypothetical protein
MADEYYITFANSPALPAAGSKITLVEAELHCVDTATAVPFSLDVVGEGTYRVTGALSGFSTAISDETGPVAISSSPADNATGVSLAVKPTVTFDEAVSFGDTGTITIYDVTNTSVEEAFDVATDVGSGAGKISVSGSTLLIEPTSNLSASTQFAIQWTAGALTDAVGNDIAALADTTTLSFTTGVSSALWTPGDIDGSGTNMAGLRAWYDASDAGTLTLAGDIVTQMNDKSGNGFHATAVGTGPITGEQISPSALNMLYFGTSAQMAVPALGISGIEARGVVMAVGERRSTADRAFWGFGAASGGTAKARWSLVTSATELRLEYNSGTTDVNAIGGTTPGVWGATHDGHTNARGRFIANGVETSYNDTGDVLATTDVAGVLGGRATGSSGNVLGDFGEAVITDADIPLATMEKLVGYLAHKWGYNTLLLDSHPYKNSAPGVN